MEDDDKTRPHETRQSSDSTQELEILRAGRPIRHIPGRLTEVEFPVALEKDPQRIATIVKPLFIDPTSVREMKSGSYVDPVTGQNQVRQQLSGSGIARIYSDIAMVAVRTNQGTGNDSSTLFVSFKVKSFFASVNLNTGVDYEFLHNGHGYFMQQEGRLPEVQFCRVIYPIHRTYRMANALYDPFTEFRFIINADEFTDC